MSRTKSYIYTRRRIRRKGKLDGRGYQWKFLFWKGDPKMPLPAVDQTDPPPYEKELLRLGDRHLDEISNAWKHADEKLKSDYCQAKKLHEQAKARLDKEASEVGPARTNFDQASEAYMALHRPVISGRWEIIVLMALIIPEIFFNTVVFSILGAGKMATYIVAAGIGGSLAALAAWLGHLLRRENKTLIQKIWIVIIPLFVAGALIGISMLRSSLFKVEQQHSILKIDLSPELASKIFIAFNLIFFLASTIISYLASHTKPEHFNNLQQKYRLAKKIYEKENKEAAEASRDLEKAQLKLAYFRQKRQKKHEQFKTDAETMVEHVEFAVSVYRTANLEVRYDGKIPKCFETAAVTPKLPDTLEDANLEWDCDQSISPVKVDTKNLN